MKKSNKFNPLFAIGAALILILGLFCGAVLFSSNTVEEKVVEVPVESEPEIITEIVEILVERPSYLDLAVDAFMVAVEDEDVDIIGDYDFDSISIRKIFDEYSVSFDGDVIEVTAKVSLKFKESDLDTKVETYDFKVTFEDDEDTEVELI